MFDSLYPDFGVIATGPLKELVTRHRFLEGHRSLNMYYLISWTVGHSYRYSIDTRAVLEGHVTL